MENYFLAFGLFCFPVLFFYTLHKYIANPDLPVPYSDAFTDILTFVSAISLVVYVLLHFGIFKTN